MYLILIRHGESVDNARGLLAGTTDSPLSSHGVIQARRLGEHLASRRSSIGPIGHVFCSDLQRAHHTAREVAVAQAAVADATPSPTTPATVSSSSSLDPSCWGSRRHVPVVPVVELREKDFGSLEGTVFRRTASHAASGPSDTVPPDVTPTKLPETQEQMTVRAARFMDHQLLPKLSALVSDAGTDRPQQSVAIVAHGIILNVLARVLLTRLGSPTEFARVFGAVDPQKGHPDFAFAFRNTGYVEAVLTTTPQAARSPSASIPLSLTIKSVNNIAHLDGLKKTRGGIGSAQFDEKQKTVDSFFKPTRKGDASG